MVLVIEVFVCRVWTYRFDKIAGSNFEQWSVSDAGPEGVEGRTPGIILAQLVDRTRTGHKPEELLGCSQAG